MRSIVKFFIGEWSSDPPHCSPIRCVALEILDAHLRVLALNNTYRGLATFLCPFGYRLVGPESIKCGHEGRWTGSVPSCKGKYISYNHINAIYIYSFVSSVGYFHRNDLTININI